ncbi:MAG TPA: tyrosine-type recombinase/integrase [Gammaproteobacteria bacterium]|nr:tyrosine-type recombinase/integrase [Gammaproteobacteria bacterium]
MRSNLTMKQRVENYLNHKRYFGFQLKIEGQELNNFVNFCNKMQHQGSVTSELAIKWASSSKKASRLSWARRLEIIRCFAKYNKIIEPETQIPLRSIFGSAHKRPNPYIYSNKDIENLLDATKKLEPKNGLRPLSFYFLINLLASTGLRISEALRLTYDDVNLESGVITVRETKFYKSRYVPLHFTTKNLLKEYKKIVMKKIIIPKSKQFFILDGGSSLTIRKAQYAFQRLRVRLGWHKTHKNKLPRLYDFRHTFVCRRLIAWYEEGVNIDQMIPFLSTYLGHVKVSDTYWYITGIPELLKTATDKFEHFFNSNKG